MKDLLFCVHVVVNKKIGNFTLLFSRPRQRILQKCVLHDHFSSSIQSETLFSGVVSAVAVVRKNNLELKQGRQQWQRRRQKTMIWLLEWGKIIVVAWFPQNRPVTCNRPFSLVGFVFAIKIMWRYLGGLNFCCVYQKDRVRTCKCTSLNENTLHVSSHDLYWENKIDNRRRSIGYERSWSPK